MLLEFLAVGTWGFWVLLAIASITMSEMLDHDSPGYATVVALVTAAVIVFFGGFNPISWIKANPTDFGLYAVGYFVAGTLWSVFKWYFWLLNIRRKIMEYKAVYPLATRSDLYNEGLPTDFPPQVSKYKSRILGWMMLWPASMVWTVINDPVRHIFEWIYDHIGGGMQAISNRVFRDVTLSK